MIDPTRGVTSLLQTLPGPRAGGGSTAGSSGFGPAAIVELGWGRRNLGRGYAELANLNRFATATLQSQVVAASAPVPIYSQKQAAAINAIVGEAVAALQTGDVDEAKHAARRLLNRDFNSATAHQILGKISVYQGDVQGAIDHFDRAATLAPDNPRIADDLFVSQQLRRSDGEVLETAAQLVLRRQDATRGIRLLLDLAKRSPLQGRIYAQIAQAFETLDLPVQQLGAFGVVLETGTTEDLADLESRIETFISENEPVGLAHSLLGRTRQKLGRLDLAQHDLEQAIKIAPDVRQYYEELANIHATAGNIALGKGDLETAQFRFEKARDLDRLNADLKLGLAAVYIQRANKLIPTGFGAKARAFLGQAESLLGNDPTLDLELAVAHMRLGSKALSQDLQGLALTNFEQAYARKPDLGGLKRAMADIYRDRGQDILDAEPYSSMSTADFQAVEQDFQKAYELFPHIGSYKSSLAEVVNEYGLKLMNVNQQYAQALAKFARARELYPDNAVYQDNYAQALALKIANPES